MNKYKIGIDGGGSKTNTVLCNSSHEIIDSYISRKSNIRKDVELAINSISSGIDYMLNKHHLNIQQVDIGIGVAGFSVIENRNLLQQFLQLKYPTSIKITSDSHIACIAEHGNCDGAVLICGTGIVAYVSHKNKTELLGAWGFPHGDLGSGSYLGLELAKLLCQAIDMIIPWSPLLQKIYKKWDNNYAIFKQELLIYSISDFAELAKVILSNSQDVYAQKLIQKGVNHITKMLNTIYAKYPDISISITGGLAKYYFPLISNTFPNLKLGTTDPAIGATYL